MDGIRGDKCGLGAVAGGRLKSLYPKERKQKWDPNANRRSQKGAPGLDGRARKQTRW